jgi:hypothetical protein
MIECNNPNNKKCLYYVDSNSSFCACVGRYLGFVDNMHHYLCNNTTAKRHYLKDFLKGEI